jgi:hypothetical protein
MTQPRGVALFKPDHPGLKQPWAVRRNRVGVALFKPDHPGLKQPWAVRRNRFAVFTNESSIERLSLRTS